MIGAGARGAIAVAVLATACGPTAPGVDAAPPPDARLDARPDAPAADAAPGDAAVDGRVADAALIDGQVIDAPGGDGGGCPVTTFTLDGALDPGVPVRAGGVTSVRLAAAVSAAGVLYVATDDAGEGSDHFLLVSATPPGAARAAPFAKAGTVAAGTGPLLFLADENDNGFSGWFRREAAAGDTALTGAAYLAATGANGGVVEGALDLTAAFGAVPATVYLAAAPYATADGGALVAAAQTPSGDGDGDLDAAEYLAIATACP